MKFVSWNVNGIRAALKKGFLAQLEHFEADVVCLQETKARQEQTVNTPWPLEYYQFWNAAARPGYAGTAVFSREKPLNASFGIGMEKHDQEGRLIHLEYEDFHLVNVYTPNSQNGLTRLDYRTQEWDEAFREFVKILDKTRPVIFCGDLNVAHQEIDLARPKANTRNAGFTQEERDSFTKHLKAGFVDTFREFEKGGGHYSLVELSNGRQGKKHRLAD